jgi:hypothetical protein
VTGLLLGTAAIAMAGPAGATGYATPVNWSGPWAAIGIGAVVMDTDTKVNASRAGQTDVDVGVDIFGQPILDAEASLFPLAQQQSLNMDGLSDAGVMGTVSLGWDHRFDNSNLLLGGFVAFDFYNISADFSSKVWAEGGASSVNFDCDQFCQGQLGEQIGEALEEPLVAGIVGGVIGAAIAHDIRDEHIEIDGKIEQKYAFQVGGRMGYIWNETFMTYFGAAWTRTKIDGHINVNIADPLCGGTGAELCSLVSEIPGVSLVNSPTSIRLDADKDVDGYKLLVGGEYALGSGMGGSWFLRGQAEYQDFDGISATFSGQKDQEIFSETFGLDGFGLSVDVARQINEQAAASIDKEDYSAHAALVYKFGAPVAPLGKPMK